MNFLEKDLEQIIFETSKSKLLQRGLPIYGKLKRQLKIGNYGISDLIEFRRPIFIDGFFCRGEIIVYELKLNSVGLSTFLQAVKYLKGIKLYLKKRGLQTMFNYRIVLIGNSIEINTDFIFLTEFITRDEANESILSNTSEFHLQLYKYSYDFNGIEFTEVNGSDYKLIQNNF